MVWAPPTPVRGSGRGWKSVAVQTLIQTLVWFLTPRLPCPSLEPRAGADLGTDGSERLLRGGWEDLA